MTYIRYPFRLNLKNCNALHAVIEHTRFSPGNIYWRLLTFSSQCSLCMHLKTTGNLCFCDVFRGKKRVK